MIELSPQTEVLAVRLAAAQSLSVDGSILRALESEARAARVETQAPRGRRMTALQILAAGAEIASLPVLDPRTPSAIMDDLNAA